jgi:hypothetical protein
MTKSELKKKLSILLDQKEELEVEIEETQKALQHAGSWRELLINYLGEDDDDVYSSGNVLTIHKLLFNNNKWLFGMMYKCDMRIFPSTNRKQYFDIFPECWNIDKKDEIEEEMYNKIKLYLHAISNQDIGCYC